MMDPALQFIQAWYQRHCNNIWEHANGITVETLAQPGWLVTIDLRETGLANREMEGLRRERSDKDWIHCEVSHGQFRGQGDPYKLAEILQIFHSWASSEEVAVIRPPR